MRDFITRYGKALDTSGAISCAALLAWAMIAGWSIPFFLFALFGLAGFVLSRALGSGGNEYVAPGYWKVLVCLTALSAFSLAVGIFA